MQFHRRVNHFTFRQYLLIESKAGRAFLPVIVLVCTLLSANDLRAQATGEFEEVIDVHEVRLTVRAETRGGRPIGGLTADDFSVSEDGEPVEIVGFRSFEPVDAGANSVPGHGRSPSSGTGAGPLNREREFVVLMFDLQGLQPRRARTVAELVEWIDAHPDEVEDRTWSVAILDGSVGLMTDHTNDPRKLRDAIAAVDEHETRDRIWRFVESPGEATWVLDARAYSSAATEREPPLGDEVSDRMLERQSCLGKRQWMLGQIDSVQQLVESMAPVPSRKSIVWIHSSYLQDRPETCEDWEILQVTRAMQDLGALAAASGVIMHASNFEGLELKYGSADRMSMGVSERNMNSFEASPGYQHNLSLGTLARNMADYTGGQRLDSNTPSQILERAFDGPTYEISVMLPHGRDGEEHKFDIELRGRRGAKLYYQRSWLDLSQRDLLVNQLRRLSLLPGSYGAFPVELRGRIEPDNSAVEVSIAVPVNRVGLVEREDRLVAQLEPYVAVHTLEGTLVVFEQLDSSPLEIAKDTEIPTTAALKTSIQLELPAGEYMVTGAFFDTLNETSGLTSARIDLGAKADVTP